MAVDAAAQLVTRKQTIAKLKHDRAKTRPIIFCDVPFEGVVVSLLVDRDPSQP